MGPEADEPLVVREVAVVPIAAMEVYGLKRKVIADRDSHAVIQAGTLRFKMSSASLIMSRKITAAGAIS